MKDKCSTKYCRRDVEVTYLGRPLCQECYEKECEAEDDLVKENEWANKMIREFLP
jgi:hypothetical protein